MKCFLCIDADTLNDAIAFNSIRHAVGYFQSVAEELDQYGQRCEASVHIARSLEEVQEYPDYRLQLGLRGGVRKERC